MRAFASRNSCLVVAMNHLPCLAEFVEVRCERLLKPIDFLQRKTEVAAERGRTSRAVQVEEGFFTRAEDVNVCRPMIVGVDDHPKTGPAEYGRHGKRLPDSKAVGLFITEGSEEAGGAPERSRMARKHTHGVMLP